MIVLMIARLGKKDNIFFSIDFLTKFRNTVANAKSQVYGYVEHNALKYYRSKQVGRCIIWDKISRKLHELLVSRSATLKYVQL